MNLVFELVFDNFGLELIFKVLEVSIEIIPLNSLQLSPLNQLTNSKDHHSQILPYFLCYQ